MFVPLVLVVLNIAYALSAFPVGALSDGANRISILIVCLVLLIAADWPRHERPLSERPTSVRSSAFRGSTSTPTR